jgi:hypothetical protein
MSVVDQSIIKHKMGLLNLAEELRNVTRHLLPVTCHLLPVTCHLTGILPASLLYEPRCERQ